MRFLNSLGNKFFGLALSAILDQQLKDTLCGTKMLFRRDYELIAAARSFFGDFDPFGDFDLLFGAAKQEPFHLHRPGSQSMFRKGDGGTALKAIVTRLPAATQALNSFDAGASLTTPAAS